MITIEIAIAYFPLEDEIGQLGEEVSSGAFVRWILSVEGHDVVVRLLHVFQEHLELLCFPPCLLHAALNNNGNLVFGMEFTRIRKVS